MDLTQLANLGEFIGGVAVLVTLVYLALQVRTNSRDVRAANFHHVTDSYNALNLRIAENNEMARLYRVGGQSPQDLTDDERVQYQFMLLSAFRVHETIFYQEKTGSGDDTLWKTEIGTMRFFFSFPGVREWWQSNPISMTPEFRNFVEERVLPGTEPRS